MRKILFSLVAVLFAITAVGQSGGNNNNNNNKVTIDGLTYEVWSSSEHTAVVYAANTTITSAVIQPTVTIGGTSYTVTRIEGSPNDVSPNGFKNCTQLTSITIPEGVEITIALQGHQITFINDEAGIVSSQPTIVTA